ncbi:hypothetical protein EC957_011700 [Mortierella hygrophila]|uniref:Uncharacterized protein n=1 Tax=Mortierella hygrophila TaxID=979708 RepID=A0A9P6F7L2_9FUNG|nr:hypothetical protein EC957_011700 [Mortierella hygrophila]
MQEAARKRLVDIEKGLKELESLQEEKRQKWLKADQDRYELTVHERELSKAKRQQRASEKKVKAPRTAQQQQAYHDLFQTRRTAEILSLAWLKNDSRLRDLRATRYALQNIAKTRPNTRLPNSTPPPTQSTWKKTGEEARHRYPECDRYPSSTRGTVKQLDRHSPQLDAIDSAQEFRRGARHVCRQFEGRKWRQRDLRDQEIRTKREAVIKDLKSKVEVNNTTIDPKAPTSIPRKRDVAVVVLHVAAGTSVGSRIKGHQKRGGSKLTKDHRNETETANPKPSGSMDQ